jgi:hypothetical protein
MSFHFVQGVVGSKGAGTRMREVLIGWFFLIKKTLRKKDTQ